MLEHLKSHLKGKVVILGIGNSLRSDDAAGSVLASRIKDKVSFRVFDTAATPENYLGKVIKEQPDTVIIIDTVDFGGSPGEFREMEGADLKTVNLFFTHNASLSLTINYLQSHLKLDIIILMIQPKTIVFGDTISTAVSASLTRLEDWFYAQGKNTG
jgi:hydrogenase 3 maturation protease